MRQCGIEATLCLPGGDLVRLCVSLLTTLVGAGLSLSAAPIVYTATLNGANEVPANASPGLGSAIVTVDDVANTMRVQVVFSGLIGTTTAAHIHCCTAVPGVGTAGVATVTPTFTGFPSGVTSGSYDNTFDMTLAGSYNPSFVSAHTDVPGAFTFLVNGIAAGDAYLNIHSTFAPGGEIRGFLEPVPEPATFALVGVALLGVAVRRRK